MLSNLLYRVPLLIHSNHYLRIKFCLCFCLGDIDPAFSQ